MKKFFNVSILFMVFACNSNQLDSEQNSFPELKGKYLGQEEPSNTPEKKPNYLKKDTINNNNEFKTNGKREYIDSANFHIIRGWYVSGARFIEVYENRENKIDSWKEYYENGNLKKKGLMTTCNHHYIGKWEYYSDSGELDSIVDYDSKQPISYFNAITIAKENDFEMPNIEVTKWTENGKIFWLINRWTEMENMAESILIDSETGQVSKPEHPIIRVF